MKQGMTKFKNSQLLILSFLAVLLSIAPLPSPSMRPTYLYFLIILLGAEAGLLSLVPRPHQGGSKLSNPTPIPALNPEPSIRNKDKPVEKSALERTNVGQGVSSQLKKFKKCPSMPSLFFIGEVDDEGEAVPNEELEDEEEMGGVLTRQELFAKAENFIGNFYKQLKMQREESWNRI